MIWTWEMPIAAQHLVQALATTWPTRPLLRFLRLPRHPRPLRREDGSGLLDLRILTATPRFSFVRT